jgi:ABC transporter substrate binding protein
LFGTRLLIRPSRINAALNRLERATTMMCADHLVHGEIAGPQPSPGFLLAPFGWAAEPVAAMMRADRSLFADLFAIDPVGAGFVASLARPGGNATGFTNYEYGMSGKWLELLKEIAPRVTRAAVLRDPAIAAGTGQLGAIQSAASSFGVELSPLGVRNPREIERDIAAFARSAKCRSDGVFAILWFEIRCEDRPNREHRNTSRANRSVREETMSALADSIPITGNFACRVLCSQ